MAKQNKKAERYVLAGVTADLAKAPRPSDVAKLAPG